METFPLYLCNMIVEACCNSIASAQAAQAAGVHRIEFLCGAPFGWAYPFERSFGSIFGRDLYPNSGAY